jgi:phage host-nuclease inhibitor protein Gam
VFSSNEPDNAPEPENSEGFCTNFDFVWLTNMAEAKRSLIKFKELYNKQSINIDDIDISDIKKNVDSIKKFDLNQFIQTYIDIAKKKWNIENNDDELFEILELIKITQKNLDDYMEKNKEIYDEIFNQTETILNDLNEGEIKKILENKDKPSIVITDADDSIKYYSEKAFILGVAGASFNRVAKHALDQYRANNQLIVFNGDDVKKVNERGYTIG